MTKPAATVVTLGENRWVVEGERDAKKLLATLTKPAYMSLRIDLGVDVWELGLLEHNYEA